MGYTNPCPPATDTCVPVGAMIEDYDNIVANGAAQTNLLSHFWGVLGGLTSTVDYSARGNRLVPPEDEEEYPSMFTIVGDYCFDATPFDSLAVSFTGPPEGSFVVLLDFADEGCEEYEGTS